jgi:hypothetical protein
VGVRVRGKEIDLGWSDMFLWTPHLFTIRHDKEEMVRYYGFRNAWIYTWLWFELQVIES